MTDDFVTVAPLLERDRWDRPMVIPPGGGAPVAYTRATTFIDGIDDKTNLSKMAQRQVAVGVGMRPDLQLSAMAHRDDKREMDSLVDYAKKVAAGDAKATNGTSMHKLTELVDTGHDLPSGLPDNVVAMVEAYVAATAHLGLDKALIERFCVQDLLKVGGTPDRITNRILDLKTGSLEWGFVKIAAQLALYSRSSLYDLATGARTRLDVDLETGTVIHLPYVEDPKDAVCTLHDVNLVTGWSAVLVSRSIREMRALKIKDVFWPHGEARPERDAKTDRTLHQVLAGPPLDLKAAIASATTPEAVRALYTEDWTADLIEVAAARVAELERAS